MTTSDIFKSELRTELESYGVIKRIPSGSTLLQEDSSISMIPIVLSGSLKVVRTDSDGHEILLYYIEQGETCIMSFLAGMHNDTSSVRAMVEEESEILFIPVARSGDWIKRFPEWSDYIFKLYHKRFEELLSVVNAVAFRRLDERLWENLSQKQHLTGSAELVTTHQQLADELGSSREVISRLLKQFETRGKLKLSRNKIRLM